jgi:hypothetical protein
MGGNLFNGFVVLAFCITADTVVLFEYSALPTTSGAMTIERDLIGRAGSGEEKRR